MNIFMILIMAVMLGMYQYFTAKKSSEVTLNKEERAFEVELNCLKQFHDYGASRNEAQLTSGPINPNYTCAGHENIKMYKYCLNNNVETPCSETSITEHCVATTMAKEKLDNSLKALLFQKGIDEIKAGNLIKGKKISAQNHPVSTVASTSFGLTTCVPAERISQNEKLAKDNCAKEGKFATLKADGSFECTDVPEVSECTAHEDSVVNTSGRQNCTGPINGKYCCAKINLEKTVCGSDPNIKATWNANTRFYNCTTGEETCNVKDNIMDVVDENNTKKDEIIIKKDSTDKFYIAKYNTTKKAWDCIPNSRLLIDLCKSKTLENELAYVSVSDLSVSNGKPVCKGASSKAPSAVETCSACGIPTLNKSTNQWYCKYPNWNTELKNNPTAMNNYINTVYKASGINNKGIEACFRGCSADMINKLRQGVVNGLLWGLTWNNNSKLFECFKCGDYSNENGSSFYNGAYINNLCKNGNFSSTPASVCIDNKYSDATCTNSEINGRCVIKCCNDLYQKRGTDGKCYTKWCRKIPAEINAVINKPQEKVCPKTHPRSIYNSVQDCVYCIKTPPVSTDK